MEKCIFYICVLNFFFSDATILLVPETAFLIKLEGEPIQIQCVYQYENENLKDSVSIKKDGMIDDNIHFAENSSQKIGDVWTSTYTYAKEAVTLIDEGRYACFVNVSGIPEESSIDVLVIQRPILRSANLSEGGTFLSLSCAIQDSLKYNWTVSWSRGNETLTNSTKYMLHQNNLEIRQPGRPDMGEYECEIILFPDSPIERQSLHPGSAAVYAPPTIDSHDNNKNMVQGDDLELKCGVSGYPLPKVKWFKDGVNVSGNQRTHFEAHGSVEGAKLKIYSLDYDDEGKYSCVATNEISPYNATAVMRVTLKSKNKPTSSSETLGISYWIVLCSVAMIMK